MISDSSQGNDSGQQFVLADEAASLRFAAGLAMLVQKGDLIALEGELGAGKTTIARGLIRTLANNPELEVPSPTFTLVQSYQLNDIDVAHMDFYRLEDPDETGELGIGDALDTGVVIVEWPSRAVGVLPADRLQVNIVETGSGRIAHLIANSETWSARLSRLRDIDSFLQAGNWHAATRQRMPADASSRRYERLSKAEEDPGSLLMDMPSRPDGEPIHGGLPYSRVAHLAEDIRAVEAINRGLLSRGLSAPEIFAIDVEHGLAIIEDFGTTSFRSLINDTEQFGLCLTSAVMLLAGMAGNDWPDQVALASGDTYQLSDYDPGALMIEVDLCLDWYWPVVHTTPVADDVRQEFRTAWKAVLDRVSTTRPVWVLRDFHVDNLFWLPDRDGDRKVGLIDTQDCVLGHPAYDLASLLQDVRVTIPVDVEQDYLDMYIAARDAEEPDFDATSFRAAYATLGAQRATKILGIFARLNARDGKPGYLKHLPRTSDVLEHNLRHPALAPVKTWFDRYLSYEHRKSAAT